MIKKHCFPYGDDRNKQIKNNNNNGKNIQKKGLRKKKSGNFSNSLP